MSDSAEKLQITPSERPDCGVEGTQIMVRANHYDGKLYRDFDSEARVLPPPTLKFHESGTENNVTPSLGKWNMIDKKMFVGAEVDSWTCVSFSTEITNPLESFCNRLIDICIDKGMMFNREPVVPLISDPQGTIEETLRDIHEMAPDLQLLIVILPDDNASSYGTIKRICETELGIVSQCCKSKEVNKDNNPSMTNVALKINVKTGGQNTVLDRDSIESIIPKIYDPPTIIMGATVTHPNHGEDSSPSIAAVVASMSSPEIPKYRALTSAQTPREEIIQDLYKLEQDPQGSPVHSGLIMGHLQAFSEANDQNKPGRIIFYRDCVSEGQFNRVLSHEVDAIRKACEAFEEDYRPLITFVVIQKHHHTRLFPTQEGDCDGNILPGTVVDTTICHPTQFDFYLNSHAGKGKSRPTHYHVLLDENGFTADEIQTLTNNLCYTYARCTRAVSVVPPAYYAHSAALRARSYMKSLMSDGGSSTSTSTDAVVPQLPAIKDNIKDVMFFC